MLLYLQRSNPDALKARLDSFNGLVFRYFLIQMVVFMVVIFHSVFEVFMCFWFTFCQHWFDFYAAGTIFYFILLVFQLPTIPCKNYELLIEKFIIFINIWSSTTICFFSRYVFNTFSYHFRLAERYLCLVKKDCVNLI